MGDPYKIERWLQPKQVRRHAKRRRFWRNPQEQQWIAGAHVERRKCPRCSYCRTFPVHEVHSYLELAATDLAGWLVFQPWHKIKEVWKPSDYTFRLPTHIWVSDDQENMVPTYYQNPELERYHWHQGPPE